MSCQDEASSAQAIQDKYGARGFQLINPLTAAWSSPPTLKEQNEWADEFGLVTVPVLSVPEEDQAYPESLYLRFELDMGPGTVVHLGPDMSLLSIDDYEMDPGVFMD